MRLAIHVKPRQPETKILEEKDGILKIAVRAVPENGKANVELLKFLKKHFKMDVRLVSGATSRKKVVELL